MLHKTQKNQRFSSSLILLLIFLISVSSCKQNRSAAPVPESIKSYVYAYTSGTINKTAPIRVRFTDALIDDARIGSETEKGILSLRPHVEGNAIWEDERTILFESSESMTSGETYVVAVDLRKLFNELPSELKIFEFDFQIREQNFYLSYGGLSNPDINTISKQEFTGTLNTADISSAEDVEPVLSATQAGKKLAIEWIHDADQLKHHFTVKGIVRGEEDSEMKLSWNGSALNIDKKGDKIVDVPSVNNFKLMDVKIVQDKAQHIELHFSDPIKKDQDLKGLIAFKGAAQQLKYTIEGNRVLVYPAKVMKGSHQLKISPGLLNVASQKMRNASEYNLTFTEAKPQLRLAGYGVIMPNSEGLLFPFEAINLRAVDIEVFKIYDNNILQFLQTNELSGNYDLERVGRVVFQRKMDLRNLNPDASPTEWTRYAVDLGTMFQQDQNALYQIRLGFRKEYTKYTCGQETSAEDALTVVEDPFEEDGEIKSIMNVGYYGRGGYYQGYQWEHREDPCFEPYYNSNRFLQRNVFASNIGIIAKSDNSDRMMLAVTDIRTTESIEGVELKFYDYQQQLLKTTVTDASGMAAVDLDKKPFVVVANKGAQKGYLKLLDPNALSLSKFDVAGTVTQKGIKGFLYGERGVWRPGDSIYLNFVLEDKANQLPGNHPVQFKLYDPRNQLIEEYTTSRNVNKIYPLAVATSAEALTGNWRAEVKIGGAEFSKRLKVETVKPNRLKIKLDTGEEAVKAEDMPLATNLQINWLHGAPAKGLKAKVEVELKPERTSFPDYKTYIFDDPARKYSGRTQTLFENTVNDAGLANFEIKLPKSNNNIAGKMRANFKIRAFEKGGDFSEDNFSKTYHPFSSYAGISLPKDRYGSNRIEIDKEGTINFVLVNTEGKPKANQKLKVGLYRVDWRWWWERNRRNNRDNFNSSTHFNALKSADLQTNSKGEASWSYQPKDWGRYLVRVCDEESGHCSGSYFYSGYPWYGNDGDNNANREGASMLVFSSDKEKYEVGEKVELRIPGSEAGRVLVSIESGKEILETYWKDTDKEETRFEFYTTAEMAPTVYAHVTLIQPHAQVKNDLPVRMYGVIPIHVEDQDTRLEPKLKMPDVLKPKETIKVEIAEENGKAMAYTIAMVDEGLLDLTRFKTPNPWSTFYAREALGVKTWDVYDQVLGAYGGQMDRLLSIGGDGEANPGDTNKKANRFEPVVRHLGPFYLERGKKATHEITLPNYVGSVRTMVVAAKDGAYGATEKTTAVRKPLMVLATLPRVLGPGERLRLPVNVFAMEKKVKSAKITVEESSGLVNIQGGNSRSLSFSSPGDEIVEFDLEVAEATGIAKFVITASGGGETASQEIEIDIRNPNPYVTDVIASVMGEGENWSNNLQPIGVKGTNTATLEVSNFLPLDFEKRFRYLIRYPHGCGEQTTSAAFPQLYVDRLTELDADEKSRVTHNVNAAINKLKRFQNSTGGFGYWPGDHYSNHWTSNYIGHFLMEAKNAGYDVPVSLLENWKRFQKKVARKWDPRTDDNGRYYRGNVVLSQAYRLYTLALAGDPDLGAMNRLREMPKLPMTSKYRLAAAYALAGKAEVARDLIQGLGTDVEDYTEMSYTYGSGLRDRAMILETFVAMKDQKNAGELAKIITEQVNARRWYSTHSTAYALIALAKFVGNEKVGQPLHFSYQIGDKALVNASSQKPIFLLDLPVEEAIGQAVKVNNTSGGILYARVIYQGQPAVGDQTAAANHLKINVTYKDLKGVKLNPASIEQGTDFIAEVQVINPGTKLNYYQDMALSQVFPSGWEILNTRMSGVKNYTDSSRPTYQDIRDDRVYSYFNINHNAAQTYRIQLNAAYAGRYYLPSTTCEAMYDNTINAREPGTWVEVVGPKEL